MSFFELLRASSTHKAPKGRSETAGGGGGLKDPLLEELAKGDVMGFGVRSEYFFLTLAQERGWSSDKSRVCGCWLAAERRGFVGRRDHC